LTTSCWALAKAPPGLTLVTTLRRYDVTDIDLALICVGCEAADNILILNNTTTKARGDVNKKVFNVGNVGTDVNPGGAFVGNLHFIRDAEVIFCYK
jgi:hypothetical protein